MTGFKGKSEFSLPKTEMFLELRPKGKIRVKSKMVFELGGITS